MSERAKRRKSLTAPIRKLHVGHHASCGSPRVHQELLARGEAVHEETVAKVMREAGIQAKSQRKFRVTTTDSNHTQPVVENILDQGIHGRTAESEVGGGHHIHRDSGRLVVLGCGHRPVYPEGGGLVDVGADRQAAGGRCVGDGGFA